jgi:hypothetical protein
MGGRSNGRDIAGANLLLWREQEYQEDSARIAGLSVIRTQ